jgi:deoxyribonuclease V
VSNVGKDIAHPWDVEPREAFAIQERLRERVVMEDDWDRLRWVGGVDIGFEDDGATTRAAAVVLSFPDLVLHEHAVMRRPTSYPYIPGLLSFREVPAALDALAALRTRPDMLLCDGQGYAHPRRFGLACHLGLLSGIPAIGVAKTHFIGTYDPVPDERGAWQPLHDRDEVIGAVLRTRPKTKPLFVSVGHRVSLASAISLVLQCAPKYRLPETTRWAHRWASRKEPFEGQ